MSAGIRRLQAAVDLLIEIDVLLVVVESQAGKQPQAIGDRPRQLAEHRGADVAELDATGLQP